jgi:hypothetical protein
MYRLIKHLLWSFLYRFKNLQQNFILNDKEEERIVIRLERVASNLQHVTVTDERERGAWLIRINPKDAINIPTPVGGIESLIKVYVGLIMN